LLLFLERRLAGESVIVRVGEVEGVPSRISRCEALQPILSAREKESASCENNLLDLFKPPKFNMKSDLPDMLSPAS
jgi:hypothetical protein